MNLAEQLEENEKEISLLKRKENDLENSYEEEERNVSYFSQMLSIKEEFIQLLERRCKLLADETLQYEENIQ